jgi:hypothetical protein
VLFEQRLIFSAAIQSLASTIVLSHNHPSGNIMPSQADLNVTAKFIEMGNILGITVSDHIIVTENGYYSFLENNKIHHGETTSLRGAGDHAGTEGDPVEVLRLEIKRHLDKCDGSRTPKLCKRIGTEQGYLQVEELIIGICLGDGSTIQTAIVNLESDVL